VSSLWLASRSPRRRELLREAGIAYSLVDGEVDESYSPGVSPEDVAEMLALRKARAGARHARGGLVLGADTVVAIGDTLFGKPTDRADAIRMLRLLSGREHRVVTGIALVDVATGLARSARDCTRVWMRELPQVEIEAYVDSGESEGKAGAYAIQETGDRLVVRLEGSWSNVVGLPMELLGRMLHSSA
jgi:septum formation protein